MTTEEKNNKALKRFKKVVITIMIFAIPMLVYCFIGLFQAFHDLNIYEKRQDKWRKSMKNGDSVLVSAPLHSRYTVPVGRIENISNDSVRVIIIAKKEDLQIRIK